MCTKVKSVQLLPSSIDNSSKFGIFVTSSFENECSTVYADAIAFDLSDPNMVIARLKGIQFQRLRLASLKRGLSSVVKVSPLTATPNRTY